MAAKRLAQTGSVRGHFRMAAHETGRARPTDAKAWTGRPTPRSGGSRCGRGANAEGSSKRGSRPAAMTPMATAPMAITVAPMAVAPNVRATPVPTERDPLDRSGAGFGCGPQADPGRRLDGG